MVDIYTLYIFIGYAYVILAIDETTLSSVIFRKKRKRKKEHKQHQQQQKQEQRQ